MGINRVRVSVRSSVRVSVSPLSPSLRLSVCLCVRLFVCPGFVQKISPDPLHLSQPSIFLA